MHAVTDADIAAKKAAEQKALRTAFGVLRSPLLFLESWAAMLIIGGLHAQPHLHGLPAIGFWATVGVRYITHLFSRKEITKIK